MIDSSGLDGWQVFVAVVWPFIQQWMKDNKSPMLSWITNKTPVVNTMLSGLVAFAATAGLHLQGDANAGWTLSIPPLLALGHVAGHWLGQHAVYTTLIQGPAHQAAMLNELQALNKALTEERAIPK